MQPPARKRTKPMIDDEKQYYIRTQGKALCNIIDNKPIIQSNNSYIINKIYENIIEKYCEKKNIELKPYDIKDIFEEI